MYKIINADALSALKELPDAYCQACITSPPYYHLRDYGVDGQIGLEKTPELYIERLVEIFREVHRVLKDDGTLWVVIGDSYAGSSKGRNKDGVYQGESKHSAKQKRSILAPTPVTGDIKRRDLIGIPWMLAFALRADGWYLRTDIIWQKPNAMPESVTNRPTRAHEYIFLLSKKPTYYYNNEAVKEPSVGAYNAPPSGSNGTFRPNARKRGEISVSSNGLRNRRSVWTVNTSPYGDAHFATFPEELVRPCILASSRQSDIILDPFAGSGTTGAVAIQEDRNFIGIEINQEYCNIIKHRFETLPPKQLRLSDIF